MHDGRLALLLSALLGVSAFADELVSVPTREGVTQSYLLVLPANGVAQKAAILFPGGDGAIGLHLEEGQPKFHSENFLVRSRGEFARRGIAVAVVDAPSDQRSGMSDNFRAGDEHLLDMRAVVRDLHARVPSLPRYLVGTSRGTVSAAYVGRALGSDIAGVVLTASVYRASGGRRRGGRPGLSGFDFSGIKSPVLLVHHRDDGCDTTPYSEAKHLAQFFPLISVKGAARAISAPCEALSAHGFLGKEPETVEAIANWMLGRPFTKEIE